MGLHVIGKLLGHCQAATTHRYAHLDADPLRRAVDSIGATISAAMDGTAGNIGDAKDVNNRIIIRLTYLFIGDARSILQYAARRCQLRKGARKLSANSSREPTAPNVGDQKPGPISSMAVAP